MIVGVLADKDVRKMADQFVKITDTFIVTEPESPRRLAAEKLANILENRGADCTVKKAVSYTHLDVYKRQESTLIQPTEMLQLHLQMVPLLL